MTEYLIGDIIQRFTYNQEQCNLCGKCTQTCTFQAITIHQNKIYFNTCKCRRCDSCEDLCPKGAMSITLTETNMQPYSKKKTQERSWEINTNTIITLDDFCKDCKKR